MGRVGRGVRIATLLTAAFGAGPLARAAPVESDGRLTLAALRARYQRPDGRFDVIGGVQVYYEDEGRGPVLLMVHGSASSLRTWDGVAAALRDHYRIVRYDIAPQGLSGSVSDDDAERLAPTDLAEGLLRDLKITRVAACVGVSSGGTLCSFLAAKRPQLVERLIVSNMPADPVTTTQLHQPPALEAAIADAKAHGGLQSLAFWNAFLDFFSGRGARIDAASRLQYYDMNRRTPEPHMTALVAKVANHARAVEAFGQVRQPALLLWGGADPLLPPRAADTLAGYLTAAQVSKVILPDVGHYPPLETPARYARLVAAYVEAATPPPPPAAPEVVR